MTWMYEVDYLLTTDPAREAGVLGVFAPPGGRMGFQEAPELVGSRSACLTHEFDSLESAEGTAKQPRALGEPVEGPCQSG